MNKVTLMGRLTRDPNVRYSQSQNGEQLCIARYTLAVDRRYGKTAEQSADFISCVAFGKNGEFAERYLKQGTKIAICGHIQTGSYTNREGQKVYTTDIVVEEHYFADSKGSNGNGNYSPAPSQQSPAPEMEGGFMNIPEGIENDLPFK